MPSVHKPLAPEMVARWLDRIRVGGVTPGLRNEAQRDGRTLDAADAYLRRWHKGAYDVAKGDYLASRSTRPLTVPIPLAPKDGCIDSVLTLPPLSFSVRIPAPAKRKDGKVLRAVVFGDSHVPYHDEGALAVVEAVIVDVKPDVLVHLGDLLDAGMLSTKFPTDPRRMDTLQADINTARRKLAQWAQLAPNAERWLFEGNHEQRLTRLIWSLQGAHRELAKLDEFGHAMTWHNLLKTEEIGWKWVDYDNQPATDCLPKLLVKHGSRVSKWGGFTAKAEWMTYGASGISGHTHRANIWRHKDYNGQATWIEAGCTCRYDVPGAHDPDWQTAVTVLEWSEDRSLLHAEQVLIRDGRAIWRGREYGG